MLDDNSKKFIKDTIEDAIDKKLDDRDKKTQASKRLDDLKYEKRSLEDRKKLLAELQTRDKKGENTIAQKFEMMKLAVDNVIPQDIKDAYKSSSKTIGNGASQVGQGISHLTERAMLSNPITAFLYNNRDILGAVGDIGIGTAKMGWGALKGIGHGALGLANSAINLFKPKQEDEDTEEETEKLNIKPPIFNGNDNNGGITKIAKQKADWQVKIDKIHDVVTKLSIGNTKSSSLLAKGLKGINDSMNAVKGFVDTIVAKQKLILGGVMLGAVAILGLAMWFQNGGLAKVLDPKNNPESSENRTNNTIDIGNISNLNPDSIIKLTNQMVQPGTTTSKTNQQQFKLDDWLKGPIETRKLRKKYNLSGATSDLLGESIHLAHGGLNPNIKTFHNEGNIKIAFPVAIKMLDVRFDETAGQGASVLIEKAEVTNGNKERLRYATGTSPRLIITNVLKLLIPKKQVIKPNTTLFVVGNDYQIIGDLSAFMRKQNYETYTNKNNKDSSTIDKNYIEQAKDEKFSKGLVQSETDYMKAAAFQQGLEESHPIITATGKVVDNALNAITDKVLENENTTENSNTYNSGVKPSVNQQKANDQNEQLNKPQEKTDKTSNNISTNPVEQPKTNLVATLPSQNIPYDFADLRSTGDINLMTSNGTTNTGVILT